MSYKLFASDLDGTLLNRASELSEENIEAFHKAHEKGIHMLVCSGRSYLSLLPFEEKLGLLKKGNYGVSHNGSIVYETDTRKIIRDIRLKNTVVQTLLKELRKFNVDILIYIGDVLYLEKGSMVFQDYIKRNQIPNTEVEKLEDLQEDVSKLLLKGENEFLLQIFNHMKTKVDGLCNMFFSDLDLLEFTDLDATKGKALLYLADYLGIDMKDTIAIGDNHNDVYMLKEAGLGIAVANAVPEAKEIAGYVTVNDNNNHAVKEAIEKFLL